MISLVDPFSHCVNGIKPWSVNKGIHRKNVLCVTEEMSIHFLSYVYLALGCDRKI